MEAIVGTSKAPHSLVSRILQVALGLFVTTSDLPSLPNNYQTLTYDCSFDTNCRWQSFGNSIDHWRIARGEPDSLLWLAATGTLQLPREPFALIETRGNPVDALATDDILCQKGYGDFSFTYWIIGDADLEVCLANQHGERFNCTGNLGAKSMPGKVILKIPEMQRPFKLMIVPSNHSGVLVVDDIRYDSLPCESDVNTNVLGGIYTTTSEPSVPDNSNIITRQRPDIETTPPTTTTTTETTTTVTDEDEVTITKEPHVPEVVDTTKEIRVTTKAPEVPFELMVYGNMTRPLFDRRKNKIVVDSSKLLCDFSNEFDCQWGVEAGKWAIVEKGAIPNLDNSIADPSLLPNYPAALVIQGASMISSDPMLCLSGAGKLLFRYWTNGEIVLQVCAIGSDKRSNFTMCVDQSQSTHNSHNLAVFNFPKPIFEPFTLNIIPQWDLGLKNRFLVLDEIAYIGECKPEDRYTKTTPTLPPITTEKMTTPVPSTTLSSTINVNVTPDEIEETTEEPKTQTWVPVRPQTSRPTSKLMTLRPILGITPVNTLSTRKRPLTYRTTTPRAIPMATTLPDIQPDDYCTKLNCNFEESACNYLNHGLTKKPWTLRNRGYGYPLTGSTDIRPSSANGQFVSAILNPGDVAIMESPKFNSTRFLNVLLFQYYRPSPMTTLRLCLGSRYTNSYRSIASFNQCPSVLRSITSRIAHNWNTVHIQIPPGTTHFYIVATNNDRSDTRTAVAIDNIRVAMCDARGFAPEYTDNEDQRNSLNGF